MRRILPFLLLFLAVRVAAAELPLARFQADTAEPRGLAPLLQKVLDESTTDGSQDTVEDERRLRLIRTNTLEALATEGYFSAQVLAASDPEGKAKYLLRLRPGPQTRVASVAIRFAGKIVDDPERVRRLEAAWDLPQGKPFRDADWSAAKSKLLNQVRERDYAAALITDSSADVDAASASVRLTIEVDSGPPFTLGELKISGLKRYEPRLVEHYATFRPGDRYDAAKLFDFQRQLQASQYFSSVVVEVDPQGPSSRAPVQVELKEAQTRRVALGLGYSTDTGPRAQVTYRQALLFGYPLTLSSGAGVDRTRAVAFADFLLPPKPNGYRDSYGGLVEHTDIQNVVTSRWAVGATRDRLTGQTENSTETQFALIYQSESRRYSGSTAPEEINNVVSGTYTWTRRDVDKVTDPRRGYLATLSATLGAPANFSNVLTTGFAQGYGRYLHYLPLSPRDQLILRAEAGYVWADSASTVPNQFLFRAGGVGSVRGYAYQSLGVQQNGAVTGSRELVTGSAEYIRWLTDAWGAAAFYDVGDAGDDLLHIRLARGYGVGGRWKTLAGPLAFDIAYGERFRQWRFDFFFAIAF